MPDPKAQAPSSPHRKNLASLATILLPSASTFLFRSKTSCRKSPARLSWPHVFGFWPASGILAWNLTERNLGPGDCIPLSLIKMQICTVNEEGNLEAVSPVSRASHQCLSSWQVGLRIWEIYVMLPLSQLHLADLQGSILPTPGRTLCAVPAQIYVIPDVGITQPWAPATFLSSRLHLQTLRCPGPLVWAKKA